MIEVYGPSALLGVDECLSGAVAYRCRQLGCAELEYLVAAVNGQEVQVAGHLIALCLDRRFEAQAPVCLIYKRQFLSIVEVHLLHVVCSERHEDVVLIVQQILV